MKLKKGKYKAALLGKRNRDHKYQRKRAEQMALVHVDTNAPAVELNTQTAAFALLKANNVARVKNLIILLRSVYLKKEMYIKLKWILD